MSTKRALGTSFPPEVSEKKVCLPSTDLSSSFLLLPLLVEEEEEEEATGMPLGWIPCSRQ